MNWKQTVEQVKRGKWQRKLAKSKRIRRRVVRNASGIVRVHRTVVVPQTGTQRERIPLLDLHPFRVALSPNGSNPHTQRQ